MGRYLFSIIAAFLVVLALSGAAMATEEQGSIQASPTPNSTFASHVTFAQRAELSCENPPRAPLPFSPSESLALAAWAALFALALALGCWAWGRPKVSLSRPYDPFFLLALLGVFGLYAAFLLHPELHLGAAFTRHFALTPDPKSAAADGLWLAHWRLLLLAWPWRAETLWRAQAVLSVPLLLLGAAFYRRLLPARGLLLAALALLLLSPPLLYGLGSDLPLVLALLVFVSSLLALEAVFSCPPVLLSVAWPVLLMGAFLLPMAPCLLVPRALCAFFERPPKKAAPRVILLLLFWALGLFLHERFLADPWPVWALPGLGHWLPLAPLFALALWGVIAGRRQGPLWALLASALLAPFLTPAHPAFFQTTLLSDLLLVLLLAPLAVLGGQAFSVRLQLRLSLLLPLLVALLFIPSAVFLAQREESFSLRLYRFQSDWLARHPAESRLYRAQTPAVRAFPDFLLPHGQKPCLRPLSAIFNDPAPKSPRYLYVSPECAALGESKESDKENCLPWRYLFNTSTAECLAPPKNAPKNAETACFFGLLGPRDARGEHEPSP